jgi:hypothetical protein
VERERPARQAQIRRRRVAALAVVMALAPAAYLRFYASPLAAC